MSGTSKDRKSTVVTDGDGYQWELTPFEGGIVPFAAVHYFTTLEAACKSFKNKDIARLYKKHGKFDSTVLASHCCQKGDMGGVCILVRGADMALLDAKPEWGEVSP